MDKSPICHVALDGHSQPPAVASSPGPPEIAHRPLLSEHSGWLRYGLAVLAVLLTALPLWLLQGLRPESARFIWFYPAIVLAAWAGGFGPGLLATALAGVFDSLFASPSRWPLRIDQPAAIFHLGVFLAVAVFISALGGVSHRARRRLEAEARAAQTAQAALSMSEKWFHCIFSQAAVGICLATPDGKMVLVNQKLCAMLGYTREELLQRTYQEITYPEDWPAQLAQARRLQAGEIDSYSIDKRYIRKDGSLLWANLTCSVIRDEDPSLVVAVIQDISDRRRAEMALTEIQDRYSSLFDHSLDCLYIHDFAGRFLDANPAALELLGYTRDEIARLDCSSIVVPEQLPKVMQAIEKLQTVDHLENPIEFTLRHKDGRQVIVETKASVIFHHGQRSAIQGIARDITDRKRVEEALRESEEKFRTLAENAHAAFGIVQGTRFVYANRYFAELSGYSVEEILRMHFYQMVHPAHREKMIDYARRRQLGEPAPRNYEFLMITKTGEERWVDFSPARMIYRGQPAIIGTGFDITERKRAEGALRESESRLAEAKEAAEAANRAKDQFLAILSHELRTPLTPVVAAATILEKDHRLSPDILEDVQMIRRNIDLEARLIDDLLDLTRITRGKLEIRPQPVDVRVILRHAVEVCSGDLDAKNLHLGLDLGAGSHWVHADPSRLQQVFWNLINNAIKFTPHGGCVGVRCRRDERGWVVVEVTDSGVGIEPEVLPRIFDAFEQGSRVVTKRFGGLGLGLAISRALVELHGGSISAKSGGKGKGATLRVMLPPEPSVPPDQAKPSREVYASGVRPSPTRQLRILLVEDHADTARLISQLLTAEGHRVVTASTLESALALAKGETFDLILSDLGLPDGSGLDLMRQLHSNEKSIKGIALSGYGMDEDMERSREAGFAEHLTKPIKFDHLEAAIARVMAN